MTPTLDQVLALADEARRSPHARRVLLDALIERYGVDITSVLAEADRLATGDHRAYAVVLRPPVLITFDPIRESLRARGINTRKLLRNKGAFGVYDVAQLRGPSGQFYRRSLTVVVVVRPRRRS